MSYIFQVPGRATNYLELQSIIKKIWKRDCKIVHPRDSHFTYDHFNEDNEWVCRVKGVPDSRFTMFSLHLPGKIIAENIECDSINY